MELQENEDYQCSFCDFKTTLKSKLEGHIRGHTREKPFLCDQCKCGFSSQHWLNEHNLRVHQGIKKVYEKKYKCSLCPYATPHRRAWETHTQRHLGERSFPCQHPGCQYAAKTSSCLRNHNRSKHKNERKFVCQFPDCGYRGKNITYLKEHFQNHSENRPFVCDFEGCNYRAKRKTTLRKHNRAVHNNGYKPFACSFCNYCTINRWRLSEHELTHLQEKTFKCTFSGCATYCKTKNGLTRHVLNLHTDTRFKCDIKGCLSTASSMSKLESHKKLVHYDKAYECPSCDFRAAIPSRLQVHIVRKHNAKQGVPCPIKGCTFQAKNRESLKPHLRHHKANLGCPFKGCGYVGQSSPCLKQHMQFHDPTGRPFSCPLCPKHFSRNSDRSKHLIAHTQEKPFQCPACNYETATKSNISRHVGSFHSTVSCSLNEEFICDHCSVNFGCVVGLEMHRMKLKTAVVVLPRLQLKI